MNISIVTAVYNDPRVERCLRSIKNQRDVSEVETIVVDGLSTDATVDVLDSESDVIDTLIREEDNGIYDAMNKGIAAANGDVIGILNADDYYADEYVVRDVLERMSETRARTCYGNLVYVNESDTPVRYWKSGKFSPSRFKFGWMPPHPAFFVEASVYEEYGMFDLNFDIAADYELILRFLMKHEVSTTYLDRVLVHMSNGGTSNESVQNIIRSNVEAYKAWQKNGLTGGLLAPVLKPARKPYQYISAWIKEFSQTP
ncbi:glycosyltransferase family 2 protein [Natrinema halophilum]|uniref:Glycosyltransferase n=1 Tax=Natrinema halophilum TaxID=1699371 RepID=A0A7D5KRY4_9EURY|nr:glycosyltransferase family 2 protein [Natrinema halophilum]QLG48924.1 glycosyltransferase [Natrinema halophilum]